MAGKDPRTVDPAALLAGVRTGADVSKVSQKLLSKIDPPGTPYAKVRLGYVTGYDPLTHTCTAKIGDQTVSISGIPVLAGVQPVLNASGHFVQVSNEKTTEYTLIGMLMKSPATIRIRKPAIQSINNTGPGMVADTDLAFYGQAGRAYLFEALAVVTQNTATNTLDLVLGWILPSGATWTGGGPGPISSIATGTAVESTGAGANWRAFVGNVGGITYGVEGSSGAGLYDRPDSIMLHGSIKMGGTSGLCSLAWSQAGPANATTRVNEGSYLKADMTSESV